MRQDPFVQRHQAEWAAFEHWLDTRSDARNARRTQRAHGALDDADIPARYRRLCQHLALARRRGYSPQLAARLQALVQRGHAVLYRTPPARPRRALEFLAVGFPRLVRAQWPAMLVAALLFWLPAIALYLVVQWRPELAASVFDPAQLASMERMYDPAASTHRIGRDGGSDVAMFGYYIWNNISIAFRTFASGLLLGVGSLVVLVLNGVFAGVVASHLDVVGHGGPFWRFVVAHAAPELTAIVIAGGAGLQLGLALVMPGRLTRAAALVQAGRRGALLSAGVLAMLVVAAFIEAFWSSLGWMPGWIKFAVGGACWALTLGWLVRAGRGVEPPQ